VIFCSTCLCHAVDFLNPWQMEEGNIGKVSFSRKATRSVFLDVCAAPGASPWTSGAEPDFHPLLAMYPFDPPAAPAAPAARTTDTPDIESRTEGGEPAEPLVFPLKPVMPVFRERTHEPSQHLRGVFKDFIRIPDCGKMWARHGMLLSTLLIILGISSYQVARVYRHFMKLEVSTLTLTPAVLLVMIIASLAGLWGVNGRRYESVALAIIAMGGIFAFLGLICKVVMIAQGLG